MSSIVFSEFPQKLLPSNVTLRSFNGSCTDSRGETNVYLGIGNKDYLINFNVVENLQTDFILGLPFLTTYGVKLNFHMRDVEIGQNILHADVACRKPAIAGATLFSDVVYGPTFNNRAIQVAYTSLGRYVIPVGHTVLIKCTSVIDGLVRRAPVNDHNKIDLYFLEGYVPSEESRIPVINTGLSDIIINKGTVIGTVTQCQAVENEKLIMTSEIIRREARDVRPSIKATTHVECYPQEIDEIPQYQRYKLLCDNIKELSTMNREEKRILDGWLKDFPEIFALEGEQLGYNDECPMDIQITNNKPIFRKNYRIPVSLKDQVHTEVDKMLKNNVIRPSKSPYNFPMVLVRKKNGTIRLCIDYRALNAITIKDKFPLPNIDDVLTRLHGAKFFTSFDLISGFWQLALHEDSKALTAFSTDQGHFEYNVIPFGLSNSPSNCQRLVTHVFRDQLESDLFLFLDDIIVYSKDLNEHDAKVKSDTELQV